MNASTCQNCSHVILNSAKTFCPKCLVPIDTTQVSESNSNGSSFDLSDVTIQGWGLIIVSVILSLVFGLPLLDTFHSFLPDGRYPKVLVFFPIVAIGLISFATGKLILDSQDISITKD